jgi:effector-binding domain-containing protein
MSFRLIRFAVASFIAAAAAAAAWGSFAQDNPATPPAAQAAPPSAPASPPAVNPAEPPASTAPAPAAPEAAKPGETAAPSGEASTGETVDLPARPFAYIEGKADRDEIYSAILGSLGLVKRDMDKANLAPADRPIAVFVESDAVKIGETPSGKAMRFEHQGAYSDIDATYDAITAYLDEKGVDAQDSFVEEYANDVKDPDDPTLQVNIYVLLK